MLHMQCWVYMVLCTCWICGVVYISYYVHDGYVALCAYGVVYIGCYVHVVYVVLCTYGVVCMLYM